MTNVMFLEAYRIPAQYIGMKKPKKRTTLKEDIGKYLLDLSKLVFGSIFLGSILRGEMPRVMLGASGLVMAIILMIIGANLAKKERKE